MWIILLVLMFPFISALVAFLVMNPREEPIITNFKNIEPMSEEDIQFLKDNEMAYIPPEYPEHHKPKRKERKMKLPKDTYHIKWRDDWGTLHSDLVTATSISQAWTKIKWRHPFSTVVLESIAVFWDWEWREL